MSCLCTMCKFSLGLSLILIDLNALQARRRKGATELSPAGGGRPRSFVHNTIGAKDNGILRHPAFSPKDLKGFLGLVLDFSIYSFHVELVHGPAQLASSSALLV